MKQQTQLKRAFFTIITLIGMFGLIYIAIFFIYGSALGFSFNPAKWEDGYRAAFIGLNILNLAGSTIFSIVTFSSED